MKKLLFVVNVDWFFISHRLPIALAAQRDGYEVHLACNFTDQAEYLASLGFVLHQLDLSRSGTGLLSEINAFKGIYAMLRKVKPDIVHLVTIKPVIYGGIASRFLKVKQRVASISGLGYIFIARGLRASILRFAVSLLYRFALHSADTTKVIFQNPDDKQLLLDLGIIDPSQAVMIRGSGVDLSRYDVQPEPISTPVVMLVARLLIDKGVLEFVEAARELSRRGAEIRMVLVGDTDDGNPKSVSSADISRWLDEGIVEHWGYQKDINNIIAQANIIVLPSYREGLPKSLIEAAACGRAVITTDVPGCRDAITPNVTGLLVPVKESAGLVAAICKLTEDTALRARMGLAGRQLAEEAFDIELVIKTHLQLYQGDKPKMVFVVNIAKFFLSHWLPEANEAKAQGYDVHVATMAGAEVAQITAAGLTHHVIPLSRSGKNIFSEFKSFFYLLTLFRHLKPELVHLMTIKPVIYGGLAARITKVPGVLAVVTGLGYVFIHHGIRAVLVRGLVSFLYKRVFAHPNLLAVFENESDKQSFLNAGIVVQSKARIINGAGVDLEKYLFLPEPKAPFTVTFAARLLKDKGFLEFVAAARLVKAVYPEIRFWVAGDTDEGNPASVSPDVIQMLEKEQLLDFLGFRDDIPQIFAQSNLVVLPSYREGLPKVLIEAAACGRAIITTDVPGCRHAIIPDETGILVPVRQVEPLAEAIKYLYTSPLIRVGMAEKGRQLAIDKYNISNTVAAYFALYAELTTEIVHD
ncbi:glycosyltransferase family 4 protein [Rheinheimera sp. MMS21-TC3]|uniref:glycosyltransferase family 4 protein n=1 Tax=Rheinheimera sp. MMS21-TC3 TaxID=3072790 RepID=UPI0028C3F259|nr:glycosyltransferase family 4 protein [Rheinheimera sp. MMS21-TC3]WNO61674.1 glycosyltransferase family 4 protein [Rheinheimera sp. MMS21-TC3]